MSAHGSTAEAEFDVFLSYSRKYGDFAKLLEAELEKFKPPRDLDVPQRTLRVFLDEEDITGSEYHGAIDRYLGASGVLVVLCSPAARASPYVNDEIRRFAGFRSAERIVPVLVDGLPNNEAGSERPEEAAFPEALMEVMAMPLAIDFRGFEAGRSRLHGSEYTGAWYTLLANIYGVERQEIEARDLRRVARRRLQRRILAGSVMAVLATSAVIAWTQQIEAEFQAYAAELSRQEAVGSSEVARVRQRQAEDERERAEQERARAVVAESVAVAEERRAREARDAAQAALVRAQQARLGGIFGTRFAQGERLAAFRALDTLSREWGGQPGLARFSPDSLRDLFVTVARGPPGDAAAPREMLDVILHAHPSLVAYPQVFGIMSHLLLDLAARHPALADSARAAVEPVRRAFALRHGAPPGSADTLSNRRISIAGGTVAVGPDGGRMVEVAPFHIQEHEVTHGEYARFRPDHPVPAGGERLPVTGVNWYEAAAYSAWLGGALPTEAQWALAARGPEARAFPWGDGPGPGGGAANCVRAVFVGCSGRRPAPVGSAPAGATPEGVHDLAGNAWEWVGDWWEGGGVQEAGGDGSAAPRPSDRGPATGTRRLLRGGSFHLGPAWMRTEVRHHDLPHRSYDDYGFRVAWPGGGP